MGEMSEIIPDKRMTLYNEHVFVFGSNLAGRHGKGAALCAKKYFGAVQGQGIGRQGRSYAIPTKNERLQVLDLGTIQTYVSDFLEYALTREQTLFEVSRVGCVLAGYKNEEIAPMFLEAPSNCRFDHAWQVLIDKWRANMRVYYDTRKYEHCQNTACWCKTAE